LKSLTDKAGLLVVLNIFKYSVGFLIPMFLVRVLTKLEYGTYQQLLIIGTASARVLVLGLPSAVYYYYNIVTDVKKRALITQTAVLTFLTGLLGALGIYLARYKIADAMSNQLLVDLIPIYCIYVVFYVASEYVVDALISKNKYRLSVGMQGAEILIRFVIIILPIVLGGGLTELILSIAFYALFRFGMYTLAIREEFFPVDRHSFDWPFIKEQFNYSIPLALSSVIGIIGRLLDRVIISTSFSTTQYAIYSVGALEIPLDYIFQRSVSNVLRATLPPLVKEGRFDEIVRIWRASVRKLAFIILPVFVFLTYFAYEFITLLFTDDYRESVNVFRVYLMLVPLHIFVLSPLPQVFGKTGITMKITIVTVISNLILSIVLVMTLGYYGPAIATIVTTYMASGIYFVIAMRLLNRSALELFPIKAISGIAAVAVAATVIAAIAVAKMDRNLLQFVVAVIVYGTSYLAIANFTGVLTAEDKRLIRRWAAKVPGAKLFLGS